MQIAIIGLPGSGKTTVFNTLTRGHADTGGYGGMTLHVRVVKGPDDRLDPPPPGFQPQKIVHAPGTPLHPPPPPLARLASVFKPKKIVHADVTYVDLPAPPPSSEGRVGTEELPAEHLARLRESDALLHVVRAFEDAAVPHPSGSVDPARDLESLDLELILADLAIVDRRLERLCSSRRDGAPARRGAEEGGGGHVPPVQTALRGRPPIPHAHPD